MCISFRSKKHLLTLLSLIYCLLLAPAYAEDYSQHGSSYSSDVEKHFLWTTSATNGAKVFLFGSLHFGDSSMYPLPSVIANSFANSDAVVVEANISQIDLSQNMEIMMQGLYQDGTTLQDHISHETWNLLKSASQDQGLPVDIIALQKPWAAVMTLSAIGMVQNGLSSELGIEHHFLNQANATDKPVLELESVSQQFNLLQSLDPEAQEYLLLSTLEELENAENNLQAILNAWKTGDAQQMQDLILGDSDIQSGPSFRINDALFTQRNIAMTNKILNMMQSGKTYFIIVGAGHLVGPSGLISLLENEGYYLVQL